MPRIQIKSLDERVATAGIHMGGGPERRKLEPFEVVDIPEDMTLEDGRNLLDVLWNTNKVELTLDDVTRPLDYADYREGRLCSPTFKPRGPGDRAEMEAARNRVSMRLLETTEPERSEPDEKAVQPAPIKKAASRRQKRRASLQKGQTNGEAIST